MKGAELVLKMAKENNVELAIFKARSPSCGAGLIYDGIFSRNLIDRDGVTVALLRKNGIKVMTEKDLKNNNWLK